MCIIFASHSMLGRTQNKQHINKYADSLKFARQYVLSAEDTEERIVRNDSLRKAVIQFLDQSKSFDYKCDSVPFLGDLHSPDNAFRIITWNLPLDEGRFKYFAFVQTNKGDYTELIDQNEKLDRKPEFKALKYNNWLGALYYEIIPFNIKKQKYYVLLGWDGKTNMSNRKIIEVMYFDNKQKPRFGKDVFKESKFNKRRVILEYTEDAYVSLRYHPEKKWIVFNHLMPMKPELEGVYEFYRPDMSFDAYELMKNGWELLEDVDIRQEKTNKPYIDPRKSRKLEPVKIKP